MGIRCCGWVMEPRTERRARGWGTWGELGGQLLAGGTEGSGWSGRLAQGRSWVLFGFCYCIGTWNVRSMNQGKLEVVKQEMARVNVYILGISKLKWTGMGEFNSDNHYIYLLLWAGNTQKKWSSHYGQQKSPKCSTWMQSQKRQNDLC